MFRKLGVWAAARGAEMPAWLMSHPKIEERIRLIEAREARWVQP